MNIAPSLADRLMGKVRKTGSCWLWTGPRLRNGYGQIRLPRGKGTTAHRASWMVHCGDIPNGLSVLHRCDVRLCVNPDHLFLGTQQENMTDMVQKGRQGKPRGERCGSSKLNDKAVASIRKDYATGRFTMFELADRYGVVFGTIWQIVRLKTWRHLHENTDPGPAAADKRTVDGPAHEVDQQTERGASPD